MRSSRSASMLDSIGELEGLVREQPSSERFEAQLMLALYRSGRQADALSSYRDTRRRLVGELGIEPSRTLQELERAMLSRGTRRWRHRSDPPPLGRQTALAAPGSAGYC